MVKNTHIQIKNLLSFLIHSEFMNVMNDLFFIKNANIGVKQWLIKILDWCGFDLETPKTKKGNWKFFSYPKIDYWKRSWAAFVARPGAAAPKFVW